LVVKTPILNSSLTILLFLLLASGVTLSQNSLPESNKEYDSYRELRVEHGFKKTLPKAYEEQALIALSHYPQLKNIKIRFKTKKKSSTICFKANSLDYVFQEAPKKNLSDNHQH